MNAFASFGMTDLEETLLSPDGRARLLVLVERMNALDAHLRCEIDAGVSPARFRELNDLRDALAAARDVVLAFDAGSTNGRLLG